MGLEAIKLELIEWLTKLEDEETIEYLKVVKDSATSNSDWWEEITSAEKGAIDEGINDAESGNMTDHDLVRKKYEKWL